MNQETSSKKILIVDDDADIIILLERALKAKGCTVITAPDGKEALAQVHAHRPDLVIADLNMPNLSGWKFSQKIRTDESYKRMPIILLSALVEKEGPAGDLEEGDFYMSKPYEFERLWAKINDLLKDH